jgi:hypothetical protein
MNEKYRKELESSSEFYKTFPLWFRNLGKKEFPSNKEIIEDIHYQISYQLKRIDNIKNNKNTIRYKNLCESCTYTLKDCLHNIELLLKEVTKGE